MPASYVFDGDQVVPFFGPKGGEASVFYAEDLTLNRPDTQGVVIWSGSGGFPVNRLPGDITVRLDIEVEDTHEHPELNDTGWIIPTYQNGWTSHSSGRPVAYRRLNGVVYVRGSLAGGTVSTAATGDAFFLPEGFRPTSTFDHISGSDANPPLPQRVVVSQTGSVKCAIGSSNTFWPLGFSFPADV